MDIIRRIRPIKASFVSLSSKHKLILITILVSLVSIIIPHESVAAQQQPAEQQLLFVLNDHQEFLLTAQAEALDKFRSEQIEKEIRRQNRLAAKLESYLRSKRSPLAEYSLVLVHTKNWKKIIALSNAESNMCRRYPESTANCWGVGGANLWDMGDNLGEGVIGMDNFLTAHPKKSKFKYSNMSFEQMNGLYKQPPGDHWVLNNQIVYDELVALENSI